MRILLPLSRSPIMLANNTALKIDGVGAQVQRLISIYALSRILKIDFRQNSFIDISVHALDPFQDLESKSSFIREMNLLFEIDIPRGSSLPQKMELKSLSSWKLLMIVIKHLPQKNALLLSVVEPYSITDAFPNLTVAAIDVFPNWTSFADNLVKDLSRPLISIHYRQGVGGLAVYPGQKISREMPPEYFLSKLQNLPISNASKSYFHLFTDAPANDVVYVPQTNQHEHWLGTPGFNDGVMNIEGKDLQSFFKQHGAHAHLHIGGNPLEAIAIMSKSDFLITSRSSLSYVAGLLNLHGVVIAAQGFWHPAPRTWSSD